MHDPESVAHEIRMFGYLLVVIWHVDPQTDGEDSCHWSFPRLTEEEKAFAEELITNEYDNLRWWFPNEEKPEMKRRMCQLFRMYKSRIRPWWKHPRWHIHHWRIKLPPVRDLKRWLFSRCARCGERFSFGYAPISTQWYSEGPKWFRSEKNIYHKECRRDTAHEEIEEMLEQE